MSRHDIIHFKHDPLRLYVGNRHLHHGLDGVILLIVALILIWTDRKDWPWLFVNDMPSAS
jgi:hypothetical protein